MALNKKVAKGIKTRQENELRENNKLIADFMGWDVDSRSPYTQYSPSHPFKWVPLMSIVEKIESFKYVDGSAKYNVRIERCTVEIIDNFTSTVFIGVDAEWLGFGADSKDIAVYKAVVEFIKWYKKYK
jgi:hypothetical protein